MAPDKEKNLLGKVGRLLPIMKDCQPQGKHVLSVSLIERLKRLCISLSYPGKESGIYGRGLLQGFLRFRTLIIRQNNLHA
jgi:hypothetical protein